MGWSQDDAEAARSENRHLSHVAPFVLRCRATPQHEYDPPIPGGPGFAYAAPPRNACWSRGERGSHAQAQPDRGDGDRPVKDEGPLVVRLRPHGSSSVGWPSAPLRCGAGRPLCRTRSDGRPSCRAAAGWPVGPWALARPAGALAKGARRDVRGPGRSVLLPGLNECCRGTSCLRGATPGRRRYDSAPARVTAP